MPTFYGVRMVAQWLGVTRDAVSNWLRRHDDCPVPAGRCVGPDRAHYFWRADQREEWIAWAHGKDVTVLSALPPGTCASLPALELPELPEAEPAADLDTSTEGQRDED